MSRLKRSQPNLYKPRRRHDSRTIALWDETDQDNGTYYRCWNCGFMCNDKRDSLGDESSRDRVSHSDFPELAVPEPGSYGATEGLSELQRGGLPSASISVENNDNTIVLVKVDLDGNPIEPKHLHSITTSGGCKSCGSANWRGDY